MLPFSVYFSQFLAAIYTVYTSPNHPSVPNHLPTLIVTPHGAFQSVSCDYSTRSDASPNLQDNRQISSTRIFTRTLCALVFETILQGRSNHLQCDRTRRTTCSPLPPKVTYVLQSSSHPAVLALAGPPLRILAIQLGVPESFVVKHLEISSGPSPIPVFFHQSTSSLYPLLTPLIFPYSKYPNRTQMLLSGACSILPMRDTISHRSGLNLERFRRTRLLPMEQEVVERGSASLAKHLKRKRYGKLLARATKTALNGWSCAQLSTSSSKFHRTVF